MLAEAAVQQVRIVSLEDAPKSGRTARRLPLNLVIDPPSELRLMREEIFGPILPVVPYDDLNDVVARINAGERPLGLCVFAEEELAADLLARTHSGGATVNGCAMQSALPSLGFGGTGMSGMGRHHGVDGFREFSNARGVVVRGSDDIIDTFYPPYVQAAALVEAALS